MKKIVLLAIGACMFVATTHAQEMMSKKGTPILPEAGDWSIGIEATPFIDWVFDKTRIMAPFGVSPSSAGVRPQQDMTFVGLYMKDANTAYRGRVGINIKSHSEDHIISANYSTPAPPVTPVYVTDNVKVSSMGITLGAGIQKSRGKGRLHGIYGAEAMISFSGSTTTTTSYGNAFVSDTAAGATHTGLANTYNGSTGSEGYTNSRTLENKTGSGFSFGVDGFVGVEYFFAPKMSFSAEYNWGISLSSTGEGSTSTESASQSTAGSQLVTVKTTDTKSGGSSDFNIANGNINTSGTGNVVFHFYF